MNKLPNKIIFYFKKPSLVLVAGEGRVLAKKMISHVLKEQIEQKKVLVFETEGREIEKYLFFLLNAKTGILVVTHLGEILPDKNFIIGEIEKREKILDLAKKLPAQNHLVLNYDDETVREIDDYTNLKTFTFGFDEKADFFVSDIKFNHGMNFKINHRGSCVPFWLERIFGKEQIYSALAATAVATLFDLNLVEISQALREFPPQPGKMRLLEGMNDSWILDDSESATVYSMVEAIEILGKLEGFKRKIAVLGDIVGVGKYTIEAHEAIGEKVAKNCDLLFTIGSRAKFIAKGAFERGMGSEKIFEFDELKSGVDKLKEEIKENDLVLVDGSKEMKMSEVVNAIRKIW